MFINELASIKKINCKKYKFADVVETIDGHKVLPFHNKKIRTDIETAIKNTIFSVNHCSRFPGRANEFGNFVEKKFGEKCVAMGLDYSIPYTCSGRQISAGYPDGVLMKANKPILYIEIKTFNTTTKESSLRSFFYSPLKDSKITADAPHILIGFETDDNKKIIGYHVVDMSAKEVSLKAEFNTNNKKMY